VSIVKTKVLNYMKERGWSTVTTSERSGIPVVTIKSIIYGKSSGQRITTLEKLAKAFDCTVNDLITDTDAKESKNGQFNADLLKECLDAVEIYLEKKNLIYKKEKVMKVIENLSSLFSKKKNKNIPYTIDDDVIEWIINNTK